MDEVQVAIVKEIANDVYADGGRPVVKPTGELFGLVPRAIKAALSPLEKWVLGKEYNIKETTKLLEIKLQNVDTNLIESPEAYVAVPALQYISYSMDNEELRNMYANLLSKAMHSNFKEKVHPAYVEIIKNFSPLDCKVFEYIMTHRKYPEIGCIQLQRKVKNSNNIAIIINKLTSIEFCDCETISSSIDNLIRNGLVSFDVFSYDDKSYYNEIKSLDYYKAILNANNNNIDLQIYEMKEKEMAIKATDLGRLFFEICAKDID